jgi:hypothetical protein
MVARRTPFAGLRWLAVITACAFLAEPHASCGVSDWVLYENHEVGLTFRHPSGLRVREGGEAVRAGIDAEAVIEVVSGQPATIVLRFIIEPFKSDPSQPRALESLRRGCRSYSDLIIDGRRGLVCVRCGRAACSWSVHLAQPLHCWILSLTREANLGRNPPAPHDGRFPILSILRTVHFDSGLRRP